MPARVVAVGVEPNSPMLADVGAVPPQSPEPFIVVVLALRMLAACTLPAAPAINEHIKSRNTGLGNVRFSMMAWKPAVFRVPALRVFKRFKFRLFI